MDDMKKTTAPDPTVDAAGDQSPFLNDKKIIGDSEDGFNSESEFNAAFPGCDESAAVSFRTEGDSTVFSEPEMEDIFQVMQKYAGNDSLTTFTMKDLYEEVFLKNPPVIEGILYPGTYLLAGAPKLGKSFLVMQIAYHVCAGIELWGYKVRKGAVLYLALEDDKRRLQERLYRMFGEDCADNLYFATKAEGLSGRLMEQISRFVRDHTDTCLIIIDTLQKVRPVEDDQYSYANDYHVIETMKQFTDDSGLCILLIHHTRKQKADDPFEMISGTNGLLGAADGAFLMHKSKRVGGEAEIEICGRDQADQKLCLRRNEETLAWDLEKAEVELYRPQPDPILEALAGFINENNPDWTGTASELVAALGMDILPHTLTMKLNVQASRLLTEYRIVYASHRSHNGRSVSLHWMQA